MGNGAQLPNLTALGSKFLRLFGTLSASGPRGRLANALPSGPGEPPSPQPCCLSAKRGPYAPPVSWGGRVPSWGQAPVPWACPRYLLNGLTHVQPHLHAVAGVGGQGHGQARHAVVAVTQDLDPHALVGLEVEGEAWSVHGPGTGVPGTSPHPHG